MRRSASGAKRAGRAVAARRHDADRARQFVTLGHGIEIELAEIGDVDVEAAAARLACAAEHDLLQPRHFIGTEGERALRAHLHAGPAILIVARRDHGHRRTIESELREIGDGRQRKADVMHLAAGIHQAKDQRLLDRERVGPEIVTDRHARLDADFMQIGSEPEPERLDAKKIEFAAEHPARVILAEAVGRDERMVLIVERVGLEVGPGFFGHRGSLHCAGACLAGPLELCNRRPCSQ